MNYIGFRTKNLPKTYFREKRPHEKNICHEKILQARAGCNYSKPVVNRQPGFRRLDSYRLVQEIQLTKRDSNHVAMHS